MTRTMERTAAPANRPPRGPVRADIQGLRAFAVLVVIANHLFRQPQGGFVGVDVFFVISGYLITAHMLRELESHGRLSFADFYRRRARRIIPAATATIVVTVIAAAVLLPRSRAIQAGIDGVWAFFFGANWRALATDTDYFQLGLPPSPFQHFWSLSVEEQFYFVWPLLAAGAFLLTTRAFPRLARPLLIVGIAFALVSAVSFAWAMIASAQDPSAAYFSTFTRAWELGAGAVLAAVLARPWRLPFAARIALAWAGVVGLVVSVFAIPPDVVFPAPTALLPVLSAVLVISAGSGISSAAYDRALAPLTSRVSGYLGDISYSLYLWHFPVIVLLPALLPTGEPLFVVAALVLTAALSVASYHLIEQPVRRSGWLLGHERASGADARRHRRHLPVLAGLAIAGVVAGGLTAWRIAAPPAPQVSAADECFGAAAAPGIPDPCTPELAAADALLPSVDELADDTGVGFFCWRGETEPLRSCTFGSEDADATRVALVGDSHAAMVIPALRDRVAALGWRVDTYTGYGCQWRAPATGDCGDVMDEIQDRLERGEAYDIVITTAARWAVVDAVSAPGEYADAWAPVAERGTRVIVVGDAPNVEEHALSCLARLGAEPSECGTDADTATRPADPLKAASALVPAAHYVDTRDLYCDEERCPAVIGNAIVYRDTAGHVTGTYMESEGDELVRRLSAAAGE
ncbi:acyltransferase family protein [Agromyces archimandritae]|uniref:Acyltransferase n=1 Tax=Agromyces archimandritae TaxID=2781962 RepID=A0A975FMM0_9MICO|nr:acyltransferase family protein [Agromyces archimandritae]QTX05253.1 acyltransferase [Agromyces archimandritae]